MKSKIEVSLPLKTTNPLNCSQGITRGAMMARARTRKAQRSATRLAIGAHLRAAGGVAPPWIVTLVRIAPSAGLDDDAIGPAMKSIRDGIADVLGLKSDRDPLIAWRYGQRRGLPREYAVEVTVASAEEARTGT